MLLWIALIVLAVLVLAGLGGGRFYRRRVIGPPMGAPMGGGPGTPVVHNTIVNPGGATGPGTTVVDE